MEEFHYQKLSSDGKACYQRIFKAMQRLELSVFLRPRVQGSTVSDVLNAISYDHPELYYVDFRYLSYRVSPLIASLNLRYYPNRQATVNRLEEKLQSILKSSQFCGLKNDYDRYRWLHDYLVRSVRYQNNATETPDHHPEAYSAIGPLLNGYGVCEGIAKAYQLLCDRAGLPCSVLTGNSTLEGFGEDTTHAWNLIRFGSDYTHVDVTWDLCLSVSTGYVRYDYFCLADRFQHRDHRYTASPVCNSEQYSLYARTGTSFATSSDLQKYLERELRKGTTLLQFRSDTNRASGDVLIKSINEQVNQAISRFIAYPCTISMFYNKTQYCFFFKISRATCRSSTTLGR